MYLVCEGEADADDTSSGKEDREEAKEEAGEGEREDVYDEVCDVVRLSTGGGWVVVDERRQ